MAKQMVQPDDQAYPSHGFGTGMNLRTKFALEFAKIYVEDTTFGTSKKEIADMAVNMADALIERLNSEVKHNV